MLILHSIFLILSRTKNKRQAIINLPLIAYYQSPLYTLLKRRILPQFLIPVHYSPFLP